jgi:hypothetical protein
MVNIALPAYDQVAPPASSIRVFLVDDTSRDRWDSPPEGTPFALKGPFVEGSVMREVILNYWNWFADLVNPYHDVINTISTIVSAAFTVVLARVALKQTRDARILQRAYLNVKFGGIQSDSDAVLVWTLRPAGWTSRMSNYERGIYPRDRRRWDAKRLRARYKDSARRALMIRFLIGSDGSSGRLLFRPILLFHLVEYSGEQHLIRVYEYGCGANEPR